MKMNISLILILTLAFLITASGCSTYAAVKTTDISITESTSALDETKEPTETAAVTFTETAAETTGETAAVTAAATTAALPAVTVLAEPATYAASFDTVRIYTNTSRTTVQAILPKGDQVTITGTADKYGVTAEGYYVNLNLMTLIITATPVPAETTAATTEETAKPTPKPTKETTAETAAPVETAAPPAETAAPSWTAPAYTENCDAIRNQIVQYCVDNGLWFPDAAATGGDEIGLSLGYTSSDNKYAESFISGKIFGDVGIQSVNCWIADGFIYISDTNCTLPVA